MLSILIVSLQLIWCSHATVLFNKPCPTDVKPIENFNLTAFASGTWYEIARYPDDWEGKNDCIIVQYENRDNLITFKITTVGDKRRNIVEGYADYAPDVGTNAIIKFRSSAFIASEGEDDVVVSYISVDYDKYIIGYECKYDEKKNMRHDYTWILSRKRILDEESKKKVNDVLKSATYIDTTKFTWDHTTDDFCKVQA